MLHYVENMDVSFLRTIKKEIHSKWIFGKLQIFLLSINIFALL